MEFCRIDFDKKWNLGYSEMSNFGKSESLKLTQTQMFASQNKQKWKFYHFEKHVLVFQLPNAFRMELMTNFLD